MQVFPWHYCSLLENKNNKKIKLKNPSESVSIHFHSGDFSLLYTEQKIQMTLLVFFHLLDFKF